MFDNSKTMRENAKPKTVFPPIEDGKPLVQSGSKIVPKTAAQVNLMILALSLYSLCVLFIE